MQAHSQAAHCKAAWAGHDGASRQHGRAQAARSAGASSARSTSMQGNAMHGCDAAWAGHMEIDEDDMPSLHAAQRAGRPQHTRDKHLLRNAVQPGQVLIVTEEIGVPRLRATQGQAACSAQKTNAALCGAAWAGRHTPCTSTCPGCTQGGRSCSAHSTHIQPYAVRPGQVAKPTEVDVPRLHASGGQGTQRAQHNSAPCMRCSLGRS